MFKYPVIWLMSCWPLYRVFSRNLLFLQSVYPFRFTQWSDRGDTTRPNLSRNICWWQSWLDNIERRVSQSIPREKHAWQEQTLVIPSLKEVSRVGPSFSCPVGAKFGMTSQGYYLKFRTDRTKKNIMNTFHLNSRRYQETWIPKLKTTDSY
jgi:hypothetical protein